MPTRDASSKANSKECGELGDQGYDELLQADLDVRHAWHRAVVRVLDALAALASVFRQASDPEFARTRVAHIARTQCVPGDGMPEPYSSIDRAALALDHALELQRRVLTRDITARRMFQFGGHQEWGAVAAVSVHDAVVNAAYGVLECDDLILEKALVAAASPEADPRARMRRELECALQADPSAAFLALVFELVNKAEHVIEFKMLSGGRDRDELFNALPEELRAPVQAMWRADSDLTTAQQCLRSAIEEGVWHGANCRRMSAARQQSKEALAALREELLVELRSDVAEKQEVAVTALAEVERTKGRRAAEERRLHAERYAQHRAQLAKLITRVRRYFEPRRLRLAGAATDLSGLGKLAEGSASACQVALRLAELVEREQMSTIGSVDTDVLRAAVEREIAGLDTGPAPKSGRATETARISSVNHPVGQSMVSTRIRVVGPDGQRRGGVFKDSSDYEPRWRGVSKPGIREHMVRQPPGDDGTYFLIEYSEPREVIGDESNDSLWDEKSQCREMTVFQALAWFSRQAFGAPASLVERAASRASAWHEFRASEQARAVADILVSHRQIDEGGEQLADLCPSAVKLAIDAGVAYRHDGSICSSGLAREMGLEGYGDWVTAQLRAVSSLLQAVESDGDQPPLEEAWRPSVHQESVLAVLRRDGRLRTGELWQRVAPKYVERRAHQNQMKELVRRGFIETDGKGRGTEFWIPESRR